MLFAMSRLERWILSVLVLLFVVSFTMLLRKFYVENTVLVPSAGGTYIEGSVGELQQLNPWFTVTNDVNRDIVSLVFAGLLKYNPETKQIEEDLAKLNVSSDGMIYKVQLKEDLFWHDSTKEKPHPVTADDVVFTYSVLEDPTFPNDLLKQNYRGVDIEKIDDRTVRFKLDEPYSFFASNLTLGLLPKNAFEGIPVGKLNQTLDFSLKPIGAGPYKLKNIVQTELSTEVTLERFKRNFPPPYRLERAVLRIFPDYQTLLADLGNLDGVRLVPRDKNGDPIVPRRFTAKTYSLPQYVALFLNLNRPFLQDEKLRLALQLGTDKQQIVDGIREKNIVDTPLLEIDVSDWRYQFDPDSAQGALFVSNWHLPEKIRLQKLLEQTESNNVGIMKVRPILFLATGAVLTLSGSLKDVGSGALINGLPVQKHPTATGAWLIALPTKGTGSIKLGDNLIRVTRAGKKGEIIDSFYLWRTANPAEYKRAEEEQRLVQLFIASRDETLPKEQRVTVQDFFLGKNALRMRTPADPVSVRNNNEGDLLSLTLLTSPTPEKYKQIGEILQKQWAALGVHLSVEVPKTELEFEERLLSRDYDILLFGQSLLDNLDSFPYWHSSGIQKLTGKKEDLRRDAYNLSSYTSFKADALLEVIRSTRNEKERAAALTQLREILKQDVPAIFLYAPTYTYAHQQSIQGIELGSLSLHSDRFLSLHNWFIKQERVFRAGKGWLSFFPWLGSFVL